VTAQSPPRIDNIRLGILYMQYWTMQALSYAPAASVSPFNYMALIRGSIIGFIVWSEVPTTPIIIGSAIVTLTSSICCAPKPGGIAGPRNVRRSEGTRSC
jgi:hypothetical protein